MTKIHRLSANHGTPGHAVVPASFVPKNSLRNEGVVLSKIQPAGARQNVIRDGVIKSNIFSSGCLLNDVFTFPCVSSVTLINVDNFSVQLCGYPDRAEVNYVLSGLRYGFRLGIHPESTEPKPAK